MSTLILLLAAGASSRMRGGDKLLEPVDGQPLITTMVLRAAQVAPVRVTLPDLSHPRAAALKDLKADLIPVPDAQEGMSASIRKGAGALPDWVTSLMILPADMPEITSDDFKHMFCLAVEKPNEILRATSQDHHPGHPVIFPKRLFPALQDLTGDSGAKRILKQEDVRLTPLPGDHAITDLDTPEDWANWRAKQDG